MLYRFCMYAFAAALVICGCDSATQPRGKAAVSFSVETDSIFLPGMYLVRVKFASPAHRDSVCFTSVTNGGRPAQYGRCPGGLRADFAAHVTDTDTWTIGFPRPTAGPETVKFTATLFRADFSTVFTADTTFLAPPQPLAAGLKMVATDVHLRARVERYAYSARNNSVVIGKSGGGIYLLDLNNDSFREVYAPGSGVFLHAITPDGDSIVSVRSSYPPGTTTLSVRPMRFAGAPRTTSFSGLPDLVAASRVYVTSNGKAFVPAALLCNGCPAGREGRIIEYDFPADRWRSRPDAGSFAAGSALAVSENGSRLVGLGGSTALECCLTYDAATDVFRRVSAGTLVPAQVVRSPFSLNYDGSLMLAENMVYDVTFRPRGDFTTWWKSGYAAGVLAPEDYILFLAYYGVIIADPLTGNALRSLNIGAAPDLYVAPDPHRTLVAMAENGVLLLRLRN
jgi:hypothetical protein